MPSVTELFQFPMTQQTFAVLVLMATLIIGAVWGTVTARCCPALTVLLALPIAAILALLTLAVLQGPGSVLYAAPVTILLALPAPFSALFLRHLTLRADRR